MIDAMARAELMPPGVTVGPGGDPPVKALASAELRQLGEKLDMIFRQYVSDRRILELRWLRNERQYLGLYDPEIEKELSPQRSKAYPKVTRVKCLSVLSRLMHLMFPGNERNWEIQASPSPDMSPADLQQAVKDAQEEDQEQGQPSDMDDEWIAGAVQCLAEKRAKSLTTLIDDQLQELGGDQTLDYIQLNRQVLKSGILYGVGILRGPYVRKCSAASFGIGPMGTPVAKTKTVYKPFFEHLKVWDFYPDLSAKTLEEMDGYFTRVVMSRAQVRALCDREDFFGEVIKGYLSKKSIGNYRPQPFETELRAMGVKVNVNEMKTETSKYEVIVWHGQLSGDTLSLVGVDVPEDKLSDDVMAEVWMLDGNVIKADMDPWATLGLDVKTLHAFVFDEDDTSPVGFGLPNAIRDSQMAISAATRMLLDNCSVVCGPNLELNTDLLRADQDLTSVTGYKLWYREGMGPDAAQPAVRNLPIDSHIQELLEVIDLFSKFADAETFVGPATGGDMEKLDSEPMRTAAGASMLRGDAALPFKDIVRSFDTFTQSVIYSLVQFNRKFRPNEAKEGDYNVIARGATSLIAKEVRGLQIDQVAATLRPEEMIHVDWRKLTQARFAVRDMEDLLCSEEEAGRRQKQADQQNSAMQELQQETIKAEIRKTLATAFKDIAQARKNSAAADAQDVDTALALLLNNLGGGMANGTSGNGEVPAQAEGAAPDAGAPDGGSGSQSLGLPSPDSQGSPLGMQ